MLIISLTILLSGAIIIISIILMSIQFLVIYHIIRFLFTILKTKTGNAISDKFEDINFNLSLNNESDKQVLSVAKLQNNILYN